MDDCIFCKIIKGEIPSAKVYEDDKVLAFLDITPVNEGHTLVVPKKHSKNILEDDIEDLKACMNAIQEVSKAVIEAVDADGFNLIVNTNKAAGQMIFHTHFHVVPRHKGDGYEHWQGKKYEEGHMEEVQKKIRKNIKT